MLEGLVRQLILGYLGRYIKDIQKEQLKITVWNEEVLLENVELTLEAFDYLELPLALKQGRVGKLSIKIPWKKLGWDPFVICLEDVFVCASQRDDAEWSADAVEKREYASKKAKLAAAELAKLSKHVSDNWAGRSFISYIYAKIFDSIQVSIRNFHVLYHDLRGDSVHTMFGLKFSSLTIMKQNPFGSSVRLKGGQISKTLEVIGLELYCGTFQGPLDLTTMDNARSMGRCDSILAPSDVSMSILVNKPGELYNNNLLHSINAEITSLEITLNEVQLQQILFLWDYISTSQLRKKYGRYRPCGNLLSTRPEGWQILWWHYAQESVLSDVRKRLKRTSWRYFGQRLSYRRKYVNLYKTKLNSIQQDQAIDEKVLRELEQIEKELDIDDILSYRSSAECKLQELLSNSSAFNKSVNSSSALSDRARNDEHLTGRSRGWLNWLSLGMLGAGGTDDSSQFSGVVSDEVIQDIYEATEFVPSNTPGPDAATDDQIYFCAIKLCINHISAMLCSIKCGKEIAQLVLSGLIIECKLWENSATIVTIINSGEMFCPSNKKVLVHMKTAANKNNLEEFDHPSLKFQVDTSSNHEVGLSVKGLLQPVEVTCDAESLINFMEFFDVFNSFESHYERVLSSLNGIKDADSRLQSKADYILSSHKKVSWDISVNNILINVPWENGASEQYNLVLDVGSVIFLTRNDSENPVLEDAKQLYALGRSNSSLSSDFSACFQVQDFNEHFEIKINDLEIMVRMPCHSKPISIIEKFGASIVLTRCIILDESISKQLKVYVSVLSLSAYFSPAVYVTALGLIAHLRTMQLHSANRPMVSDFRFGVELKLESIRLLVNLANNGENSLVLIFALQELYIQYAFLSSEECYVCLKALNVMTSSLRGESDGRVVFSSGNQLLTHSVQDINIGHGNNLENHADRSLFTEGCFMLIYENENTEFACAKFTICLTDADFHCYPDVTGLLIVFFKSLSAHDTFCDGENSINSSIVAEDTKASPGFSFQKFGLSNYFESGSLEHASIPLDCFPFITISSIGSLGDLESSLLYSNHEWRKYFNLRDKRIRCPKFSTKKKSRNDHVHPGASQSMSDTEANLFSTSSEAKSMPGASYFDFNLSGISLHFHDLSCIVGTVTLPSSICSLIVYEDCMEALCSLEGSILTSLWWTRNFHEFLWGPATPNLSSIINIRVRKNKLGSSSSNSHVEVGLSFQHVYCILPPDYLALLIGYFSLSDWNTGSNENHGGERHENGDTEKEGSIVYKCEILDSILMLPVESSERQFLKVDIQQLYSSFIDNGSLDYIFSGIPPEYLVPAPKLEEKNNCLNIFGRDLFLSFLSFEDDGYDCLQLDKGANCAVVTLLAPLSADIWIRLPRQSELYSKTTPLTTCILARVEKCHILADDNLFFSGIKALLDVINQFSLISDQSKCFKNDVREFLQLKKCFKENNAGSPVGSSISCTEVRCYVNSLLIKLHHFRGGSSELLANAEMQFTLSAVLKNDILSSLDLRFSSLELLSLPNFVVLAKCTSPSSISSVLDISFLEVNQAETELCLSFPSLVIWIHLFEWVDIIDAVVSYAGLFSKVAPLNTSMNNITLGEVENVDNKLKTVSPDSLHSSSASTYSASGSTKQDSTVLTVKLDNVSITCNLPVGISNKACEEFLATKDQREVCPIESSNMRDRSDSKYISVSVHSKSSEILLKGRHMKLKANMEKWIGTISLCEDGNNLSWPLFQMFHVFIEAEVSHDMMQSVHVRVEFQCDNLNVWLSHHFFYFWHGVTFVIPEGGPSQFPLGGIDFEIKMKKASFLLSDGRWSCSGPLFEIFVRNMVLNGKIMESYIESLLTGEIQMNYNNLHKVFWEPFIEPWKFEINVARKQEMSLNNTMVTDIHLNSSTQLNLNVTEPLIECIFRTIEMVKDSLGIVEPNDVPESKKLLNSHHKHMYAGRYAPYVLENLTSLPLVYHVYKGPVEEFDVTEIKGRKSVEPGASVPLYINDTPEEQLFHFWPAKSSDKLAEQKLSGVSHHFLTIQLDGTSMPSTPISMDRVGLTYFEVDFFKAYNENSGDNSTDTTSGFVVPVVFDVSVQRYSKLIRLYSTVVLSNATSVPIELRFDIPFGVSPKILDPIYPGQELPLPLHLAEAGRIRWRPLGDSYLWSEVYNLSNLVLQETKVGFFRSFVCYPAHLSNDPFRCCISVRNISLPPRNSPHTKITLNTPVKSRGENLKKVDESKKRFIHELTLCTPLMVNNYLPKEVSLAIESGGVTHSAFLSKVDAFLHYVDPSHDLVLGISMYGFKPTTLKFPRSETFCTMAKFTGTKFALSEVIAFDPDFSNGPIYVTVEKMMDAFSGARELSIYVPFLLYNCCGFPLLISESGNEIKTVKCIIPSSYDMSEQELCETKDGLRMISLHAADPHGIEYPSSSHLISIRDDFNPRRQRFYEQLNENDFDTGETLLKSSKNRLSRSGSDLFSRSSNCMGYEHGKVGACMYSPVPFYAAEELTVTVSRAHGDNNMPKLWSSPFLLVPPSGSTTVIVPQASQNAAFMISVTSSPVAGPLAGRSSAITFQPRYVISNACSNDICFKQKGTDHVFRMRVGEHSHLHWTDTTRELLVSVRYNGPGWQWSGSFLPDHLGDTQVKMQNYVSGSSSIIRVEVQNADVSVRDEKVVGSLHGDSGTTLILLSDDDTGYMPYRIDNFSRERLRIFQQKCEPFETIVHSYTSCPYAWDEPCYPHRLTVEVPGERVLGSYSLDDVKEYMPICLPSSSEKAERKLFLSVHAEGATKVLRVIDSNYHILNDKENLNIPHLREKRKHEQKQDKVLGYKEQISVVIPHLGISLINIDPRELVFACAKDISFDLLQSLDLQKFSIQISSLQIDNQLRSSPYPVMLSFDREYKSIPAERKLQRTSDCSYEPVFYIAVSKWKKKDISLVSFEYIILRVADFRLELEQEVILGMFGFIKNVTSRFQSSFLKLPEPLLCPLIPDTGLLEPSLSHAQTSEYQKAKGVPVFKSQSLPSVVPIGAPWQQIYLLARRQRKIYVEVFEISPINVTFSFSSAPWMLRNGILTSGESLIHRGLMALADVEGAQVHLKRLTISHHIASWESIQEIFIRHCTRQLLHEMYKVFGSAGVIGNPMGFARTLGLGFRDFLSVPARTIFQSPTGLITGMAQGTTSLLSNTVYAISDAATQFSQAAHKGIVAFTFDDQAVSRMEQLQMGVPSHSKGMISEVLEGLTDLLQSPIKGAEKHGLPGVLSGIALGVTGLVAKPAASILQLTGKTAQSIRKRSRLYQMGSQRFRVRLPRPLSREVPLRPYSWEEAVGMSALAEAGGGLRLKDEVLVACKALKQPGKFVIITERLILIIKCSGLVDLGKPEFRGIPADLEWVLESEIVLESVMHADTDHGVIHIVGSSSDTLLRQNKQATGSSGITVRWNSPTLPLIQTNLELANTEDAENLLQILLATIERGKDEGWGCRYLLHRSSIK
uniref:Vacuolar protein sorting-associated protein n=1 Tax=Cannabis sativa TaxID=3483 RepID=A0A803PHY5_CANSA